MHHCRHAVVCQKTCLLALRCCCYCFRWKVLLSFCSGTECTRGGAGLQAPFPLPSSEVHSTCSHWSAKIHWMQEEQAWSSLYLPAFILSINECICKYTQRKHVCAAISLSLSQRKKPNLMTRLPTYHWQNFTGYKLHTYSIARLSSQWPGCGVTVRTSSSRMLLPSTDLSFAMPRKYTG